MFVLISVPPLPPTCGGTCNQVTITGATSLVLHGSITSFYADVLNHVVYMLATHNLVDISSNNNLGVCLCYKISTILTTRVTEHS